MLSDVQYADHHDEETPLECVLGSEDLKPNQFYKILKVKGIPPGFAKKEGLVSSVSTIYANGADIDEESGEYIIPDGEEVQVGILLRL